LPGAKGFDERGGRCGCRDLADARERKHHGPAVQFTLPEDAPGTLDAPGLMQTLQQALLLFGQGAEDGGGRWIHIPFGLRLSKPRAPFDQLRENGFELI
jgi:hypothetical protein